MSFVWQVMNLQLHPCANAFPSFVCFLRCLFLFKIEYIFSFYCIRLCMCVRLGGFISLFALQFDCRLTIEVRQFIDTLALLVLKFLFSALYLCLFFIEHICVEFFAFMHYTFCVAAVIIAVGMHIK